MSTICMSVERIEQKLLDVVDKLHDWYFCISKYKHNQAKHFQKKNSLKC